MTPLFQNLMKKKKKMWLFFSLWVQYTILFVEIEDFCVWVFFNIFTKSHLRYIFFSYFTCILKFHDEQLHHYLLICWVLAHRRVLSILLNIAPHSVLLLTQISRMNECGAFVFHLNLFFFIWFQNSEFWVY